MQLRALPGRGHRTGLLSQRLGQLWASSHRPAALMRVVATAAPSMAPDLAPFLAKVAEVNNGLGNMADLVPFQIDGTTLGHMTPE